MEKELRCKIVIFENADEPDDVLFFNGVKGKLVRKTKHFKDAKIFNELSDRDRRFLEKQSMPYKIVDAVFNVRIED